MINVIRVVSIPMLPMCNINK